MTRRGTDSRDFASGSKVAAGPASQPLRFEGWLKRDGGYNLSVLCGVARVGGGGHPWLTVTPAGADLSVHPPSTRYTR